MASIINTDFEKEVDNLLAALSPRRSTNNRRQKVTDFIKCAVTEKLPQILVVGCGSSSFRSYLPDSDLDLIVFDRANLHSKEELRKLQDIFIALCDEISKKENGLSGHFEMTIRNVELLNARTKVSHCLVNNIGVDITVQQVGAITTLMFLEEMDRFIGSNHLLKRSIILVKSWCKYESGNFCGVPVLGAKTGMLSSYAVSILVLHVLMRYREHLHHPFAVLLYFLRACGSFPWESHVLTLDGPILIQHGGGRHAALEPMAKNDEKSIFVAKEPSKSTNVDSLSFEGIIQKYRSLFDELSQLTSDPSTAKQTRNSSFLIRCCNIQDPVDPMNNLGMSITRQNLSLLERALQLGCQHMDTIVQTAQTAAYFSSSLMNAQNQPRMQASSCLETVNPLHTPTMIIPFHAPLSVPNLTIPLPDDYQGNASNRFNKQRSNSCHIQQSMTQENIQTSSSHEEHHDSDIRRHSYNDSAVDAEMVPGEVSSAKVVSLNRVLESREYIVDPGNNLLNNRMQMNQDKPSIVMTAAEDMCTSNESNASKRKTPKSVRASHGSSVITNNQITCNDGGHIIHEIISNGNTPKASASKFPFPLLVSSPPSAPSSSSPPLSLRMHGPPPSSSNMENIPSSSVLHSQIGMGHLSNSDSNNIGGVVENSLNQYGWFLQAAFPVCFWRFLSSPFAVRSDMLDHPLQHSATSTIDAAVSPHAWQAAVASQQRQQQYNRQSYQSQQQYEQQTGILQNKHHQPRYMPDNVHQGNSSNNKNIRIDSVGNRSRGTSSDSLEDSCNTDSTTSPDDKSTASLRSIDHLGEYVSKEGINRGESKGNAFLYKSELKKCQKKNNVNIPKITNAQTAKESSRSGSPSGENDCFSASPSPSLESINSSCCSTNHIYSNSVLSIEKQSYDDDPLTADFGVLLELVQFLRERPGLQLNKTTNIFVEEVDTFQRPLQTSSESPLFNKFSLPRKNSIDNTLKPIPKPSILDAHRALFPSEFSDEVAKDLISSVNKLNTSSISPPSDPLVCSNEHSAFEFKNNHDHGILPESSVSSFPIRSLSSDAVSVTDIHEVTSLSEQLETTEKYCNALHNTFSENIADGSRNGNSESVCKKIGSVDASNEIEAKNVDDRLPMKTMKDLMLKGWFSITKLVSPNDSVLTNTDAGSNISLSTENTDASITTPEKHFPSTPIKGVAKSNLHHNHSNDKKKSSNISNVRIQRNEQKHIKKIDFEINDINGGGIQYWFGEVVKNWKHPYSNILATWTNRCEKMLIRRRFSKSLSKRVASMVPLLTWTVALTLLLISTLVVREMIACSLEWENHVKLGETSPPISTHSSLQKINANHHNEFPVKHGPHRRGGSGFGMYDRRQQPPTRRSGGISGGGSTSATSRSKMSTTINDSHSRQASESPVQQFNKVCRTTNNNHSDFAENPPQSSFYSPLRILSRFIWGDQAEERNKWEKGSSTDTRRTAKPAGAPSPLTGSSTMGSRGRKPSVVTLHVSDISFSSISAASDLPSQSLSGTLHTSSGSRSENATVASSSATFSSSTDRTDYNNEAKGPLSPSMSVTTHWVRLGESISFGDVAVMSTLQKQHNSAQYTTFHQQRHSIRRSSAIEMANADKHSDGVDELTTSSDSANREKSIFPHHTEARGREHNEFRYMWTRDGVPVTAAMLNRSLEDYSHLSSSSISISGNGNSGAKHESSATIKKPSGVDDSDHAHTSPNSKGVTGGTANVRQKKSSKKRKSSKVQNGAGDISDGGARSTKSREQEKTKSSVDDSSREAARNQSARWARTFSSPTQPFLSLQRVRFTDAGHYRCYRYRPPSKSSDMSNDQNAISSSSTMQPFTDNEHFSSSHQQHTNSRDSSSGNGLHSADDDCFEGTSTLGIPCSVPFSQYELIAETVIRISQEPQVQSRPSFHTPQVGEDVFIHLSAEGQPPPLYQWMRNGYPIPGETSSTLVIRNVQREQSGAYSCEVYNIAGSFLWLEATLQVV